MLILHFFNSTGWVYYQGTLILAIMFFKLFTKEYVISG